MIRKRLAFLVAAFIFTPALAFATSYKLDTAHSNVGFSVRHLGISKVKGQFNGFQGSFDFDAEKNKLSNINVSIKAASVDTSNKNRDKHLRSDDFFGVVKHPTITFKSEKPEKTYRFKKGGSKTIPGFLTIKGKTKKVKLKVSFLGAAMMGKTQKVGFEAITKIKRHDFDVAWNNITDKGIGKEVTITINIEANLQK